MQNIGTSFRNTFTNIKRSGWLSYASILVMTLAFLVTTIFGFLAFVSNLFLLSIEQEPQIYVFFEIGTDEKELNNLKNKWERFEGVEYVNLTTEEQAKEEFYEAQKELNELAAEAVEDRQLPSSLAIRLRSLEDSDEIIKVVEKEEKTNPQINAIRYGTLIVEDIKHVFSFVRYAGITVLALLILVIFLFTLLTVEFRMHSRSEEIEIMQLVGGSLGYIRLPFVLEGAIYGALGAFFSNIIICIALYFLSYQITTSQSDYIQNLFADFPFPEVGTPELLLLFFGIIFIGAFIGAFNSFIAILKYIK